MLNPLARAERLFAAMSRMVGTTSWRLELWDEAIVQRGTASRFTLSIKSPEALDLLVSGLPERAFGRAYVSGMLEVEPLEAFLELVARAPQSRLLAGWPRLVAAAVALGARPQPGLQADAEARLRGRRHSRQRDAAAIRHHYDLPPEFYALWLDSRLTYSCGYFEHESQDLDSAQVAKMDLVCRKLRLQPGERLLDVGCGWGGLVLHAAQHYGAQATGITLSPSQVHVARQRARDLGLEERARFELLDYRDVAQESYDAIASVGMIEHVGRDHLAAYGQALRRALRPGGRALVHGITCRPQAHRNRSSFINTFVFPDGELEDVGLVVRELERSGLEVRDVENLREHYVLTLAHWVHRLQHNWDRAVELAGSRRARVWLLYMTGSAVSFRMGAIAVHQTLVVRQTSAGASLLPLTRDAWYGAHRIAAAAAVNPPPQPAAHN